MDLGLSEFQNIISSHHFLRQSTYRNQVHVALVEGSGKKGFRISDRVKEGTLSGALPSTTILQQTGAVSIWQKPLAGSWHFATGCCKHMKHPEAVTPRSIKFQMSRVLVECFRIFPDTELCLIVFKQFWFLFLQLIHEKKNVRAVGKGT
ncbi:hypothetical protein NC652_029089 [Populus alba x Populus x berolinensis]|nr:hypothetical protein NC652_029089 [Populus alba x Populus x berolinensis]